MTQEENNNNIININGTEYSQDDLVRNNSI